MITHAEESSEECSGLENEGLVLEEEEGTEAQLVENNPPHEHTYEEWVVVEKPTLDKEGLKQQTCMGCGVINTQVIERLTGAWKQNKVGWWYELSDGSYLSNCRKNINSALYTFNGRGYMQVGWAWQSGKWTYHQSLGAAVTGWQYVGNKWYYMDVTGIMQTGWQYVGSKWYYLNGSGVMQTGWQYIGNEWYYLDGSGAMQTGWQYVGSKWYYLDGNGVMQTGWQYVGNKWYYLDSSGSMMTGWLYSSGKWYYLSGNGAMITGWRCVGNRWYYMDATGAMITGWQYVGNQWYYMDNSGAMKSGWVYLSGRWYYLNGSGAAVTGWHSIGGQWYYFFKANDKYGGPECAMSTVKIDRWQTLLDDYKNNSSVNQLIFVQHTGGTRANVQFYKKQNGNWSKILSCNGYVGRNGIDKVKEGDKRTPTGTFNITGGFGIKANPGTNLNYTQVNSSHYWCGDKAYYNRLININQYPHNCRGEHLIDYKGVYDYGLFTDFNSSCTYGKGSAIFMHCIGNYSYTGGCIAVDKNSLLTIMRNIDLKTKICIYPK